MEEIWWCDELNKYIDRPKRANRCASFCWNDIPADGPLERRYRPRRKRDGAQMKLGGLDLAGGGGVHRGGANWGGDE